MRLPTLALSVALSLAACNVLFDHDAGRYVGPAPCTTDAMSDPDNCGACGHSCRGGACVGGACQPVALVDGAHPVVNGIWDVAISGSTAFFTSWCASAPVFSVPVDGGTATALAPGNDFATCGVGMAVDEKLVFFGSVDYASEAGSILFVPRSGGKPTSLVAGLQGRPFLAVDGSHVFYLLTWSTVPGVFRMGRDGSGGTTVHSTSSVALAVDAQFLYVAEAFGNIIRMSKDGSSKQLLAGSNKPVDMTVDATSVYWSDATEKAVYSVPIAGGNVTRLAVGMLQSPNELAVDDRSVYVACAGGGVVAVDKDGTNLRVVASQPELTISGIAVDDTFVYWGNDGTPSGLWRVAK
jgi:hypothetical protein